MEIRSGAFLSNVLPGRSVPHHDPEALTAAKCGNGPNMVLSPLNVTLSHVNTIAKMREVLETVAAVDVPQSLVKVCPEEH